jgi:hypothetical protein
MVQKDAYCCGTDPSILDNRSVRGGSRDPLKSIKNLTKGSPKYFLKGKIKVFPIEGVEMSAFDGILGKKLCLVVFFSDFLRHCCRP